MFNNAYFTIEFLGDYYKIINMSNYDIGVYRLAKPPKRKDLLIDVIKPNNYSMYKNLELDIKLIYCRFGRYDKQVRLYQRDTFYLIPN